MSWKTTVLRRPLVALVSSVVLIAAASCGGSSDNTDTPTRAAGDSGYASLSGEVVVDGSSTVGPIAEAAAEEFGKVSDVKVAVGISGTSGGFEKFCRGETDISNASRPMRTSEAQACADSGVDVTEFRIAIDGLTVAVNPANTWASCLTFSQLRKIFDQGSQVNNWNEVDPSFPDKALKIFSPGADSGTFDYFSEEINGTLDQFRNDAGVTFSEDDNVLVSGVESADGAIGYFGYAYYSENKDKLKALQVDRDQDRAGLPLPPTDRLGCIAPSEETVLPGTYPLSRPLFMYAANEELTGKPQVRGFIRFVLENPQLIRDVGYVELEDAIYRQNLAKLKATE